MSRKHSTRSGTSSRHKPGKRTASRLAKKRAKKVASTLEDIHERYARVFKRLAD